MTRYSRRDILKAGAALAISPGLISICGSSASAADPYADAVLKDGEPPAREKDSFTIAVLPDTQYYSESHPDQYLAQTSWIVENLEARNIACVLHLGDVTNRNTPAEWKNAVQAMNQLDGKVPYFMTTGNHDYSARGTCQDRTTGFNEAFPVKKFKDLPTFGGIYDKEPDRFENSYHLFSAGGRDFVALCLEFGPRKDVIRWANEVAAKFKDRAIILNTHAFVYTDNKRYDWRTLGAKQSGNPHSYPLAKIPGEEMSDGEELWNGLVSRHENFILTLNGHVTGSGLGRLVSSTPGKRDVNQSLVNFQMKPRGGDGWLRLLEFRSDGKTVQTYDYSPTRKQRNESDSNQFRMTLASV